MVAWLGFAPLTTAFGCGQQGSAPPPGNRGISRHRHTHVQGTILFYLGWQADSTLEKQADGSHSGLKLVGTFYGRVLCCPGSVLLPPGKEL